MSMKVDYSTHYGPDYWTGRKTYHAGNKLEVYHGPGLAWEGFKFIAEGLSKILPRGTLLDIGCGGGDLARRLRHDHDFDTYGCDVSEYAIEHALVDMRDRLHICDITKKPEFPPHFPATFRIVMATDLLEHIYEEDLDETFEWMLSKTEKWLFFCVATCSFDKQVFVAKKGEPIPREYEATAVSGHVNVRPFSYWHHFFVARHALTVDWRRMYLFQMRRESIEGWRNTMGWNMQTTFVLEKAR